MHNYAKARQLRRTTSLPEVLLWQELRKANLKFRRQHPVGPYVLDFYCAAAKVGVEVDGIVHELGEQPHNDEARHDWLRQRGISVVRVPAMEVLRSASDVAASIIALCR